MKSSYYWQYNGEEIEPGRIGWSLIREVNKRTERGEIIEAIVPMQSKLAEDGSWFTTGAMIFTRI